MFDKNDENEQAILTGSICSSYMNEIYSLDAESGYLVTGNKTAGNRGSMQL